MEIIEDYYDAYRDAKRMNIKHPSELEVIGEILHPYHNKCKSPKHNKRKRKRNQ